jgi:SAM-dependent methyltransferase
MIQNYYESAYKAHSGIRPLHEVLEETERNARGLYNYVLEMKAQFLADKSWEEMTILETGGGHGGLSILLAKLGAKVVNVDFSPSAIEMSKKLVEFAGVNVKAMQADLTHPDIEFGEKFDLIVDSHLLHCITGTADRTSYYQMIRDHLKDGGIFICETMVHKKNIFIPDGFMFDPEFTLWQLFGEWTPIRKILDSLDLETELKESKLDIIFFYYYAHFAFVPHAQFMELPTDILPASVRFVVKSKPE